MTTQAIAINVAARRRYLLVLLFAGFVLTGVEITLTGPMMPQFIARWSLSDSQAGVLLAVEFSGSLAGVWLSSLITHYFSTRTSLVLGYLMVGGGLATVNTSSMTVVLFALGALGIGYGLVVPPTNLAVAEIGGKRSASLVSLVNFAWGAGAVSCSPLVLLALKNGFLPQFLIFFAGFGGLLAFSFLFAKFPEAKHAATDSTTAAATSVGLVTTLTLAALFFLYVGVEVSLGSWAAAYAKRLAGGGAGIATLAPMFFYGGLLAGRAFAPFVLARIHEYRLVIAALILVIIGNTALVLAATQKIAFASAALAGLGCAAIFPVYVAWLSRWYGARAARLGSLMFSMSSLGSAFGPWLVGFVSAHAGGLRIGLLVPLASAVAMMVLLLLVRRQAAA
ncbi:MAG TPA: MFS transporter [Candidatus Binatus sp.]|nr:MFS transporter [Candidatus Binatus sp.]